MANFGSMARGLGSAASSAWKLGKGIAAAGEAMLELAKFTDETAKKIIHLADAMGGRWVQMNDLAFKTARTMAMSRDKAIQYNNQLIKSTKELAAQYGISAREMADFQKSYSEAVGRNVVLTQQQIAHMSALSKITDNATAAALVDEFDKLGIGIAGATAQVGLMQERAKALGINATKATKMLRDNIKLASTYSFRNGVDDIERMALKAASMRMDMNEIMRATEKFADIEGAITNSANIQLLGGSFAQNFSNPMGAMYEAMADPKAFQDRIFNTIKGKGRYDEKTGAVTFDPVTMMQMREMAKSLGMSAEQLNTSAMAVVQNEKVMQELSRNSRMVELSEEDKVAIQNLARTNVGDDGRHYVTWLKDGVTQTRAVEDLTKEELAIAKDNQLTQEKLWGDVHDIADLLHAVHGRARETKSVREAEKGLQGWWDSLVTGIQDFWMKYVSGGYNAVSNSVGTKHYAQGGIVKPLHGEDGMIVPGNSYTGDKVPAMLNSGEMVLNASQQKSMFDMISSMALGVGSVYGINKFAGRPGMSGIGSTMMLASAIGGGDVGDKEIIEAHLIKSAIKDMKPLKDSIKGIAEASKVATESTSGVETRLGKMGKSIDKFSQKMYSPFEYVGKKLRSTKMATSITDYYNKLKAVEDKAVSLEKLDEEILDNKTKEERNSKKKDRAKGRRARKAEKLAMKQAKMASVIEKPIEQAAKPIAKASKAIGTLGKVAKVGGRMLGPLGVMMSVGGSVVEGFNAKSRYDEQMKEIPVEIIGTVYETRRKTPVSA